MLLRVISSLIVMAAAWPVCTAALAQKRVALVIGNNAYKAEAVLKNAANDAALVAASLAQANFRTIDARTNLGIAEFRQALRRFQADATGAEVAMIYFAGHGMEANGGNWLVPTDAELRAEVDLDYEAISLDLALKALSGAKMRIMVLDACRNNPFGRSWRSSSRSVARGLKALDTDDVLVLFAAAPGQTASDGIGGNSPFATAFAKRLPEPGLPVQLLGGRVRDDVLKATNGAQRPYVSASITGEPFYLLPGSGPTAAQSPLAQSIQPLQSAAAEAWAHARDSRSIPELEAFVRRFGDTFFGDVAQGRLEAMKLEQAKRIAALERERAEAERTSIPALVPGSGQPARDRLASGQLCPSCPEMVLVPAGKFSMGSPATEAGREAWDPGSESPLVSVLFARPFLVSRFTVTRGEFAAFVSATGYQPPSGCTGMMGNEWKLNSALSWRSPGFQQDDRHPVVCVSWYDATAYVQWLARITGQSYRLASEAEREYAARAGTTTAFWWGSHIAPEQANYSRETSYMGSLTTSSLGRTVVVDSFQPNPWGLYQVHGNVHELTQDCWSGSHLGSRSDGAARSATNCILRTMRSGGWNNNPILLRAAARGKVAPDMRQENLGFRVARNQE